MEDMPNVREDWGNGMLQAGMDYYLIDSFDEALGMRELRAKVNGALGGEAKHPNNRFSINAEFCYHAKSIEVVRKFLDGGFLAEVMERKFPDDALPPNSNLPYTITIFIACFMTLGCTIPKNMMDKLKKIQDPTYQQKWRANKSVLQLKPLARVQMKKAIAEYKNGIPYNFGNKTFLEATTSSMMPGITSTTIKDLCGTKVIEMKGPGSMTIPSIIGPPTDDELGVPPIHPNHLCAACGAKEQKSGGELLACSRCHDRKYCSKECQKKHFKLHKPICTRPAKEMEKFIKSIKHIDFGKGDETMEKAMEEMFI